MKRILVLLTSLIFLSQTALAGSTQPFFDLVEIKRTADGELYEIMIRQDLPDRPMEVIQEEMLAALAEEQAFGVMYNPIPMSNKKLPGEREFNEYRKIIQKIIKKLQSLDLKEIFRNASLKRFLEEFQERLIESTRDFKVIARPNDSDYFHSNKIMQELLKQGLKEAVENLPGTIAGVAAYIISETVRMLIDRRTYYQNFVAHYLLNHSPEELGLSAQEVAWTKSSIHESKIAWDKPWDSWDAEDQWDSFGTEKYNAIIRKTEANWERESHKFEDYGDHFNMSFVPVVENGVEKIMNTYNKKHRWNNNLSEAFSYDKPCKQMGYRLIMRLIEFGVTQVPVPNLVKKEFKKFISSTYASQTIQEGYLTAYMMSNDMPEVKYILLQGFNPLVIMDHQWDSEGNNRYAGLSCR